MTEADSANGDADTSKARESPVASTSALKDNARRSPSGGKEERADTAKRLRKADVDMAARGRRMFGLLNSTLSKAKEDNARRSSGEAARKRAEVEARLQEKLKAEDQLIKQHSTLAEDLKVQLALAYKIAMDIHSTDSMIRLRKAQKRRLASFLVTPSESANYDAGQARKMAADERVVAGDVASCIAPLPIRPLPDPPVYFLPKRMLPKQENRLDDQEDRTDEAIEAADQAWEQKRSAMQDDLSRIKDVIETIRVKMQENDKPSTTDKMLD